MNVRMSGVGALPDLDIALDGLTVVTGMNGTGKSTLLKAIYSTIQPSHSFESAKEIESRDRLRGIITNSLGLGAFGTESKVDALLKQAESIPENAISSNDLEALSFIKDLLRGKKDREFYAMRVEEAISIEYGSLSQFTNLRTKGQASVEISYRNETNRYILDSEKSGWSGSTGRLPRVIYYDTPFVMDPFPGIHTYYDHRAILYRMIHNTTQSTIQNLIGRSNRENFDIAVKNIVGGEFTSGAGSYITPDGLKVDVRNMAAGMKVFAIMRILLEKGCLSRDSILLLDEPEIHLHPSWINVLASAIVALVRDIGVRVVMTTHNPQLLMAIEGKSHDVGLRTDYYNLTMDGDDIGFSEISDDLQPVYAEMARPLIEASDRFLE